MALAAFGARPDGGVDRQTLTGAEVEARAQLVAWGRALGLKPFTDAGANLFLRWDGREPDLPPVLAGSHIDSQPTGGKFDGAYGVLAALEAVQARWEKLGCGPAARSRWLPGPTRKARASRPA